MLIINREDNTSKSSLHDVMDALVHYTMVNPTSSNTKSLFVLTLCEKSVLYERVLMVLELRVEMEALVRTQDWFGLLVSKGQIHIIVAIIRC